MKLKIDIIKSYFLFICILLCAHLEGYAQNDTIPETDKEIKQRVSTISGEVESLVKDVSDKLIHTFQSTKEKYKKLQDTITDKYKNKKENIEWEPKTIIKFLKFNKKNEIDTCEEGISDFYDCDWDDIDSMLQDNQSELEKDLNANTEVFVQKSTSARNAPGIVTIISKDEIKKSGARDLMEILSMVPGFEFALDEKGRVGLGVRGNWTGDGKILLRIDGQEMNDIFTARLVFGNHYPADLIERIEIMRGPGSVIYGGFAEFGVINIITKSPDSHNGMSFHASVGKTKDMISRKTGTIYYGKKWENTELSISTFFGEGQRSDKVAYAFYDSASIGNKAQAGKYESLKNNSDITPVFFNIYFRRNNLTIRNISDGYGVTDVTRLDKHNKRSVNLSNNINYTELKYKLEVNEYLTLEPKLNFIAQVSEELNRDKDEYSLSDFIIRPKFGITGFYSKHHRRDLIFGFETFKDIYKYDDKSYISREVDEDETYKNAAFFGQGTLRMPFMNIIAGFRFEKNSVFGNKLVPRVAFTKQYKKFHFKLLVSRAFRAPAIGNILNGFSGSYKLNDDTTRIELIENDLKAESTRVFEFELGYMINENLLLTTNFYNINIKNPIAYYYYSDPVLTELYKNIGFNDKSANVAGESVYQNFDKAGSIGTELNLRYKADWGFVDFNYSFYTVTGKEIIPPNSVSNFDFDVNKRVRKQDDELLGFSKHKFNLNTYFYLCESMSFNFSVNAFGKKYGYVEKLDENGFPGGHLVKESPKVLLNAYLHYDNLITKGLHFGIGARNILNHNYTYYQSYFGINPPLPTMSREFYFKLAYNFDFRK